MHFKLLIHIFLFSMLIGMPFLSPAQTCKIGDVIINRNDRSRGVVFWINPERTGGWIIALKNLPMAPMAKIKAEDQGSVTPYNPVKDTAGYTNTAKLRNMCIPGDYNVLKIDFEHGWYIPAIGQLWQLATVTDIINPVLRINGGEIIVTDDTFGNNSWFLSSSPDKNSKKYHSFDFSLMYIPGSTSPTNDRHPIRAVRTFAM